MPLKKREGSSGLSKRGSTSKKLTTKKSPTLPKLKAKAWKLLSELIRRQEANLDGYVYCYTCNAPMLWKQSQAGHGIGGRTGTTLLDEHIIRVQCYSCNVPGRGQYGIFAAKLIEEHGLDLYNKKQKDSKVIKKWSRSELEEKIEEYRTRLAVISL